MLRVAVLCLLTTSALSQTVCYEPCGCFSDEPPFDDDDDHLTPASPEDQQLSWSLFTLDNPSIGVDISWDDIPELYDPGKTTVWLVHGWRVGPGAQIVIKNAFLNSGYDYNIIMTDWSVGADDEYKQSRANIRVVGACSGYLADTLETDMALVYCVGHSLGGQTCGYMGEYINGLVDTGMLGRITGIDPAGAGFETDELEIRLDPGDAAYVDVIHTNCRGLVGKAGTPIPSGHVDFYPYNGGVQPGCDTDLCDHVVAESYFRYSVEQSVVEGGCEYLSCPIDNEHTDSCIPDTCDPDSTCQSMGFNAINYPGTGVYYIEPTEDTPHCPSP